MKFVGGFKVEGTLFQGALQYLFCSLFYVLRRKKVFKMDIKVLQRFYFLIVLKFNHDSGRSQQKISFNIQTLTDKFHGVQHRRIRNS